MSTTATVLLESIFIHSEEGRTPLEEGENVFSPFFKPAEPEGGSKGFSTIESKLFPIVDRISSQQVGQYAFSVFH